MHFTILGFDNMLQLLAGFFLGAILGYGAWEVARRLISEYEQPGVTTSSDTIASLHSSVLPQLLLTLSMALWGGYAAWHSMDVRILVTALVTTAIFVVVVLVDYAVHRIPNKIVIVFFIWAVIQVLWLGMPDFRSALFGVVVGGGVFLLFAILGRGALGMGDVKFVAAEGALLGYPFILYGMFWGIIFGGLAAMILLVTKRAGRKDSFAYGPYLALGAWLIFLGMMNLLPWQH